MRNKLRILTIAKFFECDDYVATKWFGWELDLTGFEPHFHDQNGWPVYKSDYLGE